jgi:hypothetical protein
MTTAIIGDKTAGLWRTRANRWLRRLESYGFTFCGAAVYLFTDDLAHDFAVGHFTEEDLDDEWVALPYDLERTCTGLRSNTLGFAAHDEGGVPTVFVRIDKVGVEDPVNVLIHELLHHAVPSLSHKQIYWLAAHVRAGNMVCPEYVPQFPGDKAHPNRCPGNFAIGSGLERD